MTQRTPGRGINPAALGRTSLIFILVLVVVLAAAGTTKIVQVDEGERGIVVKQGAIEGIQEPGMFFRPFAIFTDVKIVDIKRQSRQITQNVASSDKQLYDVSVQVDYSRKSDPESLRKQYSTIGVDDTQLHTFLDGFINDALKSASTRFTLDQVLSDRGTFTQSITQLLRTAGEGQTSPIDQLNINLEAVKVLDIEVGEAYARLLAEKANLEVQIETEEKRRQQIEAQQSNNLFQAEQEARVKLTTEKGLTAAALEAANRDSQIRAIEGRYWRENPELFELRKRELQVQMMQSGNLWFVDPNTNLTLLLNQTTGESPIVVPPSNNTPPPPAPTTPPPPVNVEPEVEPTTAPVAP
jgi:regulator of protease activity HflC (stomatin/prohibitin superfamily)